MKKYPEFKRGEIESIYETLISKERKIIDNFVSYVAGTSQSIDRHKNVRRQITQFRYVIGKDFDKIDLDDLREFLALLNMSNRETAGKSDLKSTIKRFLKWKFEDWSKRFRALEDIKTPFPKNEKKLNADTILDKKDIEEIMKAENRLYWKALFMTLYETGLRPIELRNLTWNNVKLAIDGDLTEINVYATKTKRARSVYVKEATKLLQALKNKQHGTNLVFPSARDKNRPITKEHLSVWLSRISERVLGRKIYPYILRHTRATELYLNANVSEKIAQKFLGHNKSMSDIYTNLSNKDVREATSKSIYKIDDLPEEKKHALEVEIETLRKEYADFQDKVEQFIKNYKGKTRHKVGDALKR